MMPPVNTLPPVMLAPALTAPLVNKLAPVMLLALVIVPVALIMPPVSTLPSVAVPVALTVPAVAMLPLVVVPVTDKSTKVPTVVKLENITLLLRVLPVKLPALTLLAVTPVN